MNTISTKKILLLAVFIDSFAFVSFAQNISDSLVKFSELKYHSEFERSSFQNYIHSLTDTFNVLLSIDENLNGTEADRLFEVYNHVFDIIKEKKIDSKNINKKIKIVYPVVHDYFLKKYNSNDYFPIVFQTGNYNCVTASVLYSMVFDKLKIPFKVMASSEHAYLIANPGENSIVIETTNPNFEKAIFTGEYKQQYREYVSLDCCLLLLQESES